MTNIQVFLGIIGLGLLVLLHYTLKHLKTMKKEKREKDKSDDWFDCRYRCSSDFRLCGATLFQKSNTNRWRRLKHKRRQSDKKRIQKTRKKDMNMQKA